MVCAIAIFPAPAGPYTHRKKKARFSGRYWTQAIISFKIANLVCAVGDIWEDWTAQKHRGTSREQHIAGGSEVLVGYREISVRYVQWLGYPQLSILACPVFFT
jgi:hypothetical protein